jgi:surface antigen
MLKRVVLTGAVVTGLMGAAGVSPASGSAGAAPGPNPYPVGTSTYWAWQNRPDLPASLGEAKEWDDKARALGWPVGAYPRPGAIAVHEPGVLGADATSGRVAFVRQVLDNGSYTVTVMNDSDCAGGSSKCGTVYTRYYPQAAGTRFIHYRRDSRTTWGFAAGASGWTANNMGPGAPEAAGWRYTLTGGDAQLLSPELFIPVEGYNAIEVQMSLEAVAGDGLMNVYFSTEDRPGFSVERRGRAVLRADGALHAYRVYFGSNRMWKGDLARLKVHPARPGAVGSVRVERIRLIKIEDPSMVGRVNAVRALRE